MAGRRPARVWAAVLRRAALSVLAAACCYQLARAEPSASTALARVGPLTIDAELVRTRAARLTPQQRALFGSGWPEQRRRLLAEQLVPEALLQLEAARVDRGLFSARDRALAAALRLELEREVLAGSEPRASRPLEQWRLEPQRTLLLWRISLRSEADALSLLKELGQQPADSTWTRLARERSIDKATHMRGGTLGYVDRSGQTHMSQVRVAPALFAAAEQVKDGEIVPHPVPEGPDFAVLWRRASREEPAPGSPAVHGDELGAQLVSEAVDRQARSLTERLRAERLRDHRPELVAGLELRSSPALAPTRPAGTATAAARPVTLAPRPTDSGLR